MQPVTTRRWPSVVSRSLLIAAAPLFLLAGVTVLITWPRDVVGGVVQVFSGRDVVQVADGKETGVALFLLVLAAWGVCWLLRVRLPDGFAFWAAVGGAVLWLPAVAALGIGAEYGLQAVLAARGYGFCTFHVTGTDRGGDGTYVYVRNDRSGACDAVRAVFPPGALVPGKRGAFDLPAR